MKARGMAQRGVGAGVEFFRRVIGHRGEHADVVPFQNGSGPGGFKHDPARAPKAGSGVGGRGVVRDAGGGAAGRGQWRERSGGPAAAIEVLVEAELDLGLKPLADGGLCEVRAEGSRELVRTLTEPGERIRRQNPDGGERRCQAVLEQPVVN